MADHRGPSLESRILAQIAELERHVAGLLQEKAGLQRVLTRLRRERAGGQEVGRRNSVDRVLVEARLLDYLRRENRAIPSSELYEAAKEVHPRLKETTFRSHLHRMKQKNIIGNAGHRRGVWVALGSDGRRA